MKQNLVDHSKKDPVPATKCPKWAHFEMKRLVIEGTVIFMRLPQIYSSIFLFIDFLTILLSRTRFCTMSIYIIAQRYSVCSIKFSTFFKWWDIVSLITKYIYDVNSFSFKNLTKKKRNHSDAERPYSYLSKYVFKPCIFHRQSFVLRTSMFWCAIKICYLQICLHLSQLTKVQFCECFHTCSFPSSRVPFPVVCVAEFPP